MLAGGDLEVEVASGILACLGAFLISSSLRGKMSPRSAPTSAAMLTRVTASFRPSKRHVSVRAMTTKSGSDLSRCLQANCSLATKSLRGIACATYL